MFYILERSTSVEYQGIYFQVANMYNMLYSTCMSHYNVTLWIWCVYHIKYK